MWPINPVVHDAVNTKGMRAISHVDHPVKQSAKEAGELNEDMQTVLRYVNSVIGHNPSVTSWNRVYEATQEDALMCKLMEKVYRGFPQTSYDLDPDLRPYFKHQHDLHVVNGVVCYKDRVIVPAKLRPQVLEAIHSAHQGVSGMISRVEDTVWRLP